MASPPEEASNNIDFLSSTARNRQSNLLLLYHVEAKLSLNQSFVPKNDHTDAFHNDTQNRTPLAAINIYY